MVDLYGETLHPGARAGTYVVEALVGVGGWSTVYRARHHLLGRAAAVKVLHPALAASPAAVERFFREAQLVNQIRHPGVVDVFELGRLPGGRPYLVMELLEGEDLESRLRARGGLPIDEALAILEPLAGALDAVHAQRIVHRDVKASNVFVAAGERVVLLDLGIAKLLEQPGPALTTARRALGSPSCIAPEQVRGAAVDHRADVYALGTLAYHVLAGVEPFQVEPALALELHLTAERPQLPRRVARAAALDPVIARAMSIDPAARHASAGELVAALRTAAAVPVATAAPAIGLYLAIELAEVAAPVLDALHDLLAEVHREAAAAGFAEVARLGPSRLFAAPLDAMTCARAEACARAIEAVLAARRTGELRAGLCLHLADGPALCAVAAWAPDAPHGGIARTARFAEALGA